MIKVSIFSFPIFGDFNELLANSVLLAMYIDVASKKVFFDDPPILRIHSQILIHFLCILGKCPLSGYHILESAHFPG